MLPLAVGATRGGSASVSPVANGGQGSVRVRRPVDGARKMATSSRRSTGKRYGAGTSSGTGSGACAEPSPLSERGEPAGMDVGALRFATLSTRTAIANPRCFRGEEPVRAQAQRRRRQAERGTPERGTPERAKRRHVVAPAVTWAT
jgi:hypothetical protein